MPAPSRSCTVCQKTFAVTPEDREFLDRLSPVIGGKKQSLPEPTLCVECRQQRRVCVANQLNLYKRTCDLTGETVVSNIHPDSPYKVYKQESWYSDVWDPMEYGRDIDFTRPFFDQFHELSLAVPRPSLFTGFQYDENSEYTNHAGKNKNCYLIFDSDENRDCYYCYSLNGSESCMDCFRMRKSELCYECVDSLNCYSSAYLQDCDNCIDSMFLKNCIGCKNCLMSSNLRNKQYYVENKKVTKEQFEKIRAMLVSRSAIAGSRDRFEKLKLEHPQKYMHGVQNDNVLGDYLTNCKNAHYCFDCPNLWDCRYVFQAFNPLKDCMDIQECGDGEKLFECAFVGYGAQNVAFATHILGDCSEILYSSYSPHSKHLFGCVGLRRKEYCILNKQYTKEEYETLVPKLIEHMRKTKEWGEFFPATISAWAYNETLAQDYFPLTKQEALKRGYTWRDEDPKSIQPATATVPDALADVPETVTHELLACTKCKKNYRIIPQEFALYAQMRVPVPEHCFDCRLRSKMKQRNQRTLYERACGKCKKNVQSTYDPKRPEKILCEDCYTASVD